MMTWLTTTFAGKFFFTVLVSMVPVAELRFGIPFGVAQGLPHLAALAAAIIGNMLPIPFILIYIRRIFKWMRHHLPKLDHLIDRLEARAHLKGKKVTKYRYLGLFIFVAIPLPGTGAWTGALIAALLDMRLRDALPAIFAGVLAAGIIVTALTFGVTAIF